MRLRARVALFAVALVALTLPACQKDATPDPFVGPSELSLSLTLSASPDVLPLDGASQSLVSILARDGSGQVLPNVTLRLQISFGGVLQDLGQLSARTLVTGQDGRALATYTAPLGGSEDPGLQVDILVTPVGDNFANAVARALTIRLVPGGVIIPPFTIGSGFRFTPTGPVEFQEVLFQTDCLSTSDTNCVTDPGAVATYAWDFGDGTTGSGPTATHTYSSQSTFTAVLTVTDGFSRSTSESRSVTVGSGGTPTANFTHSPTGPRVGDSVLNASASTAPAGRSIVSYDWQFGDGDTASGVTVTHEFSAALAYSVSLTVTDDQGKTDTQTRTVAVVTGTPTPLFSVTPSPTAVGIATIVDAARSTPTSGATITSYAWNFGDTTATTTCPGGAGCVAATPHLLSHTYTSAGTFVITLTVTDSFGLTAAPRRGSS